MCALYCCPSTILGPIWPPAQYALSAAGMRGQHWPNFFNAFLWSVRGHRCWGHLKALSWFFVQIFVRVWESWEEVVLPVNRLRRLWLASPYWSGGVWYGNYIGQLGEALIWREAEKKQDVGRGCSSRLLKYAFLGDGFPGLKGGCRLVIG